MLKAIEFDLKTGQTLTEYDPQGGQRQTKVQEIEHCYLEQWFKHHDLEPPPLFVAQFYDGVDSADPARLAQEGKALFSTNGAKGYFTDPATAALISQGDPERNIQPIYAADLHSAHNAVAYGSLITSDGKASYALKKDHNLPVRILVVDDEKREFGVQSLVHWETQRPIPPAQLESLLDRMGDGTLLVSEQIIESLILEQDVAKFLKEELQDSTPETLEALSALYLEQGSFAGASDIDPNLIKDLDKALKAELHRQVIQFRAATPDFPGMAKGTLTTHQLLEKLDVDLVLSTNDIKGDDGQFSQPGLHEVGTVWLNRKSDARHRTQVVGPQVKGTLPQATASELNPKALARLEKLKAAAADPHQLALAYVEAKAAEEKDKDGKPDPLAIVLKADTYGTLETFPSVVDQLERWLRREQVDIALNGNKIPSATAQHHSQLKPWEVCNPKLPDGAVVAYYRSPFPNAGAAALAINNHAAIATADDEAFNKQGVAYLNPWTAKQIAITDFDGDANGFFVGYTAKEKGALAAQLREQLASLEGESPAAQYEAARATFAQWIAQEPEQSPLRPADFPQVVNEFTEQNAPENKPPAITKQPKIKHAWNPETERLDQAIWRAWETTAQNPIGRVANAGMVLQSFANECAHGQRDREGLAGQISQAYRKVLKQVDQGKLELPSDDQLEELGLPALNLRSRLERIAGGEQSTEATLSDTHDLLMDVANGPVALNLQTAVDIAKSSRGIDEGLQQLARALQYKPHELRAERKNRQIYTQGKVFPINTDEPTAWMVEAVNAAHQTVQLPKATDQISRCFSPLIRGEVEPEGGKAAQALSEQYYGLVGEYRQAVQTFEQQGQRSFEQPSLWLTSETSGKTLQVERLLDGLDGAAFDWRAQGKTDWQVSIRHDPPQGFVVMKQQGEGKRNPEQRLGWINGASARDAGLAEAVQQSGQVMIRSPEVQLKPPAALENDLKELRTRPQQHLDEVAEHLSVAQKQDLLLPLWKTQIQGIGPHKSPMAMNLAMRMIPEQVAEQLAQGPPPLYLSRNPDTPLPTGQFQGVVKTVMEPGQQGKLVERKGLFQQQATGEPIRLGLLAQGGPQVAANIEVQGFIQESTIQAAQMTVATPQGEINVTKVQQHDFSQTPFQGESATLQLQYSPLEGVKVQVVEPGKEPKTLGRLGQDNSQGRAAARAFWQAQGQEPWQTTLQRKTYQKVEVQFDGEAQLTQPRSFAQALEKQQQAQQVLPSYSQLQQWWQVAHARNQTEVQADVRLMGDGLVLAWQHQGHRNSPPLNFRSAQIVLQPQQAEQMQQALKMLQQQRPTYSPSYQELQALWQEAEQTGNSPFQEKLAQLGQQLVAAYQFESGSSEKPAADYKSADIQLARVQPAALAQGQRQQRQQRQPRRVQSTQAER